MSQTIKDDNIISADLEKLRSLAQKKLGQEKFQEFRLIIESLIGRQNYARYHYGEYRKIIDKRNNGDIYEQVGLVVYNNNGDYWDQVGIEANIIACMQHLHTIHDILGHLIAYVLDLKFEKERHISLKNVHTRIKQDESFSNLNTLLEGLINDDNFDYLIANVNQSKHKYNIEPLISISLQEELPIRCEFPRFVYHGRLYLQKSVDKFILEEFGREDRIIICIENELIRILENSTLEKQ